MSIYYGILYESADGQKKARAIAQSVILKYMREAGKDDEEIKALQAKLTGIFNPKQEEPQIPVTAPVEASKTEEKPKKVEEEKYICLDDEGSFLWFLNEAYEHGVTPGDWFVLMNKPKTGIYGGILNVYVHYSRPAGTGDGQVISTSYKLTNRAGVQTLKNIMMGKTIGLEIDPALSKNLFDGRLTRFTMPKKQKQEPTGLYADFAKQVQDIRKEPEQWKPTSPDVAKYGTQPSQKVGESKQNIYGALISNIQEKSNDT